MDQRKKQADANQTFLAKARDVFNKYDYEAAGSVDAWDIRNALKEMGHEVSDEMIFHMLRTHDGEQAQVSFERFLLMCDNSITSDGIHGWGKRRAQNDLASAWEAVGGKKDLTGEVDIRKLKNLFELFELKTKVDTLIHADQEVTMIDYQEFCTLLDTRGEVEDDARRMITPDMRRPFVSEESPQNPMNRVASHPRS